MASIFDSMPNFQAFRDAHNVNNAPPTPPTSIYNNRVPFSNPDTSNTPAMPVSPLTDNSGGPTNESEPAQDNGFFSNLWGGIKNGYNHVEGALKGAVNPFLEPPQGPQPTDLLGSYTSAFKNLGSDLTKVIPGYYHGFMNPEEASAQFKTNSERFSPVDRFGLNMATDPLTYAPLGTIAKVAAPAVKYGAQAAMKIPGVGAASDMAKDALGKVFKADYGLTKDYAALKKDYTNKIGAAEQGAVDTTLQLAKPNGKLMSEADRRLVAEGIENPKVLGAPGFTRAPQEVIDTSRLTRKLLSVGAREEKAAGLLNSTRQNYFPHVKVSDTPGGGGVVGLVKNPMLKASDKFTKERGIDGTIQEINAALESQGKSPLFEDDFAKAFGTREVSRQRAITTDKFVKDALSQFGQKISANTPKYNIPDGYSVVKPDGALRFFQHGGVTAVSKNVPTYLLPTEVAKDLEKFNKRAIDDEGMNGALKLWDKGTNLLKGLYTSPNPSFHITNAMGNVFNNALAGVKDPMKYLDAAKVQLRGNDLLGGITKPSQYILKPFMDAVGATKKNNSMIKVGNQQYTANELYNMARSQGITGTGQFGNDIPNIIDEELGRGLKTPWSKAADAVLHPIQTGRVVGNLVENNGKLAHFLDRLSKGDAPLDAANSVEKHLFNYGDLSTTEKEVFKRIIPFYTWSRKNIPLQVETLAKNPQVFAQYNNIRDNMAETVGADETNLPDYMKAGMAMPISKDENDITKYLTPRMPIADLNRIHADPLANFKEIAQMVNPLITVPAQLLMNNNMLTNTPISKYEGETKSAPYPLNKLMPGNAMNSQTGDPEYRIPSPWSFAFNQLGAVRNASQTAQEFDSPSGKTNTMPIIGSYIKEYNPAAGQVNQMYDQRQKMTDLKRKMKSESGPKLSPWSR